VRSKRLDGKGKARPSGARNWSVVFGILAIRSQRADGGQGIFLKEFKAPTVIHRDRIEQGPVIGRVIDQGLAGDQLPSALARLGFAMD
jgi:hypothetical protein